MVLSSPNTSWLLNVNLQQNFEIVKIENFSLAYFFPFTFQWNPTGFIMSEVWCLQEDREPLSYCTLAQ
jgi:hypothetical protein